MNAINYDNLNHSNKPSSLNPGTNPNTDPDPNPHNNDNSNPKK